jgi:hypothetical protein
MSVPEAAVDEDHGVMSGEHKIRTARKFAILEAIAESSGM